MTKTITYQVPAKAKNGKLVYDTRQGKIAHLFIGAVKVKCVLQYQDDALDALVHYASGQIIARLGNRKLMLHVGNPYNRYADRTIAEMAIQDIISQKSPDAVRAMMEAAPVVNRD